MENDMTHSPQIVPSTRFSISIDWDDMIAEIKGFEKGNRKHIWRTFAIGKTREEVMLRISNELFDAAGLDQTDSEPTVGDAVAAFQGEVEPAPPTHAEEAAYEEGLAATVEGDEGVPRPVEAEVEAELDDVPADGADKFDQDLSSEDKGFLAGLKELLPSKKKKPSSRRIPPPPGAPQ